MTVATPRVLYVNSSSIIGGAETNLLNILRYAYGGGFSPVGVVLPCTGPLVDPVRSLNIPVAFVDYYSFELRNPLRYCETIAQLAHKILRTRAELVHLNHQWLIEPVVAAAHLVRRPVVCHVRNLVGFNFVTARNASFNRVEALVPVSGAVNAKLMGFHLEAKTYLIFDGIPLNGDRLDDGGRATVETLDIDATDKVIGFCGRVVPEKGPEDLLHAFRRVLEAIPNAHLVFCGTDQTEGKYIAHLGEITHQLGVVERVHFLGFRSDVRKVLASFDVLAVPSRSEMPEGLPLTILEAFSLGSLVVATRNSGIPEIVVDGETGFLVECDDRQALASALVTALELPAARKKSIRQAAMQLVATKFSIEQQVTELGNLYRRLIDA